MLYFIIKNLTMIRYKNIKKHLLILYKKMPFLWKKIVYYYKIHVIMDSENVYYKWGYMQFKTFFYIF